MYDSLRIIRQLTLLFFPRGEMTAASSQPLLVADGSAAQVALAAGYAYVSEKNGSLEAFRLGETATFGDTPPRLPAFPRA